MPNLSLIWSRINVFVTLFLLAVAIGSTLSWYITDLKLTNEISARAEDKASYERAQAEYEAEALRQKLQKEEEDRKRAEEADSRYAALLSQYNASLVRYKDAQRAISRAYLSGSTDTPEGGDGPSGSPVLPEDTLIISYDDALICAVNTARLKAVQEWATQ